jgi:GTP-binding protein LepA
MRYYVSYETTDTSHIRNFSIVAHIDHGKSTISDRILELTHTVDERDMADQLLDTMDIERERGITIKSNAVRVVYDADDGESYQFNLIDTPGHVDFTYEVSRSLAACEGAVLVVDATQGVEAQTVSNATLAMNANLDIVPCINKIDLPSAHPEEVKKEIEEDLAIPADDAVLVSGKTGEGIHDLLEAIVYLVSPPKGDAKAPLKALILDSYFDEYRGVVATVRVFDGSIKKGDHLRMMALGDTFLCDGVGCKRPLETPLDELGVGEVGYVVTGLKDPALVRRATPSLTRTVPAQRPAPATTRQSPWSSRVVPHRQQAVREPARRPREAQGERPVAHLDARDERGSGLWLSRGLPRPSPHGGREGAPRARVWPRPHCHIALG